MIPILSWLFLVALLQGNATADAPLVSICQVLEDLRAFEGKEIRVHLKNFNFSGPCQAPKDASDPRFVNPNKGPANGVDVDLALGPVGTRSPAVREYNQLRDQGYDVMLLLKGKIRLPPPGQRGTGLQASYPAVLVVSSIDEMFRSLKKGPPPKIVE